MAKNVFVDMYTTLISFGRWTLDRVPIYWKNEVALKCYDLNILELRDMPDEQREFVEGVLSEREKESEVSVNDNLEENLNEEITDGVVQESAEAGAPEEFAEEPQNETNQDFEEETSEEATEETIEKAKEETEEEPVEQ